jgi:hypothetical protein
MKNHFNQILWVLIILILMLWFYKIENSYSEMDRLKDTVDRQSTWIQNDTNRVKIYYQLQFLFAPEVLDIKLPQSNPYEVHYKKNGIWHVLHFKTLDP